MVPVKEKCFLSVPRGFFLLSPTVLSNGLDAPHFFKVIIAVIIVQTTVDKVHQIAINI